MCELGSKIGARRILGLGPLILAGLSAFAAVSPGQTQTASAETKTEAVERLRSTLEEWRAERGLPGVSAAIVKADGSAIACSVGKTSLDTEGELKPDGRMLSGSVGKTYVAASILRLVGEKRLDLDRTAYSYLGETEGFDLLPNAEDFTLRQLLRHESGLPRYVMKDAFWKDLLAAPDRVWTPIELLSFVFDDEPLFAAGEGWAYSDTNYVILGMVVERVAETSFYDFVTDTFLKPLELVDTVPSNSRTIPGMVQGHVVTSRAFGVGERVLSEGVFTYNPQFEWCGGGWASTPLDLARWTKAFYGGEVLPDGSIALMEKDAADAPSLGPGTRYGLGVMLWDTPHGPVRGHRGFLPGYLTATAWYTDLDLAVTFQVNSDDARSAGRLEELLDALAAAAIL